MLFAEFAVKDNVLVVIVVLTQVVVLHVPSALTKYVVVLFTVKTGTDPEKI